MFPPLSLLLSIFMTSKRKNERMIFFFFFLKNLGTFRVHMQKYPKSMSTQKVSGTGTAPFLEYPCFIAFRSNGISWCFQQSCLGFESSPHIKCIEKMSLKNHVLMVFKWRLGKSLILCPLTYQTGPYFKTSQNGRWLIIWNRVSIE